MLEQSRPFLTKYRKVVFFTLFVSDGEAVFFDQKQSDRSSSSSASRRTQRSRLRHACFLLAGEPERFSAAPILSVFLSSSSILIMLYFRPSRLRPPPVLLHPRPPIISSSTHPPFINRWLPLTTLARQPCPRGCRSIRSHRRRQDSARGSRDSPPPPPPSPLPPIFFFQATASK